MATGGLVIDITLLLRKLDGVALLITDPPQTSFITLSKKKNKIIVTHDMWHMTHDK